MTSTIVKLAKITLAVTVTGLLVACDLTVTQNEPVIEGEPEIPVEAASVTVFPSVTPSVKATVDPNSVPEPATAADVPGGSKLAVTATMPASSTGGSADADVEFVRAVQANDGSWTFHVTIRHPDTGWENYADGWDVVAPGGDVIKKDPDDLFTRLLLHPHENEQPFTRSQSGLRLEEGGTIVTVRAHDIVDGFGGREVTVNLEMAVGSDFEVVRP